MLGKKNKQLSLGQTEAVSRLPKDHFLKVIEKRIDWRPIEKELNKLYPSKRGRPSYPPLMMFKALLLENWYNLSDPALEEAIRDRISFQWFMGLSFTDDIPDETTICRFRNLLVERGLHDRLFGLINEQLDSMGLILKRGSLIDATLVEANRKPGGDPDADWTKRGKKAHHGYKVHMTVDQGSEIIRNVDLTPASVHDSAKFVDMICGDEGAVFADKAYDKDGRKAVLREYGIYCGIMNKGRRNRGLSRRQKKLNKAFSRVRSAVERPFGVLKRSYGWRRVRYVGLMKNRAHIFMASICFNLKKMVVLVGA